MGISSTIVIALLIASALGAPQPSPRICYSRFVMQHHAPLIPFSEPATVKVPLYVSFACSRNGKALGKKKPLVILMEGALTRPKDYTRLGNRLARKGFVVALPDYVSRDLVNLSPAFGPIGALLEERRNMGFKCPKKPQFATTKLISSVQLFFKSKSTRRDLRRAVDLNKVVIFGHSYGGDVSNRFFNSKCEAVDSPAVVAPEDVSSQPTFFARVQCEQFSPATVPTTGVLGIVTFEGVNDRTVVDVSKPNFHVAIHSKFYQSTITNVFSGKDFNSRTATVRIANANHYGPNNFVKQFGNQTPLCAGERRPPEDAFTTTRKTQNAVIDSITEVVFSSVNSFVDTNGLGALDSLTSEPKLLVEEVTIQ